MYPLLTITAIEKILPQARRLGVSQRARSEGQFLSQYRRYGENLPLYWKTKRENFIKRHLAQYKMNPTLRRKLALNVWAYEP